MNLISIHLARRLKTAGVQQVSEFYYNRKGERYHKDNICLSARDFSQLWTSAFSSDELFIYINKFLAKFKNHNFVVGFNGKNLKASFVCDSGFKATHTYTVEAESLTNICAKITLKILSLI